MLLFYPYPKEELTEYFSAEELREALLFRNAKEPKDFVYINTSCWSATAKTPFELETINSVHFINIPSLTIAYPFRNEKDSAVKILLDATRYGWTFKETREVLKKNVPEYKAKTADHYIFPDETEYEAVITNRIVNVIKYEGMTIYDELGAPVSAD